MLKILVVADALISSGFAQVTHNVFPKLVDKFDIKVFGIGYDGRVTNKYPFEIYPAMASGDLYGFRHFQSIMNKEKPEVVLLFNDLSIIYRYLDLVDQDAIKIAMFPVNLLPIDTEEALKLSNCRVHHVISYTEWSKQQILAVNPNLTISSCYHGVDREVYYPINDAKKAIGISDETFLITSVNTNTYRKRLDLLFKGFCEFADDKDDVLLLLHYNNSDQVWDFKRLAKRFGVTGKIVFSNSFLPADQLNIIYNACDLFVATPAGEGFGLSEMIAAACNKPLLITDTENLRDIWGDSAEYIKATTEIMPNTNQDGAVVNIEDLVKKLNKFYYDRDYLSEMSIRASINAQKIKFNWGTVADKIGRSITFASNNGYKILS